jgi:hypothetical protein
MLLIIGSSISGSLQHLSLPSDPCSNSQQLSSIQFHQDSESYLIADLQSKICQQEVEFMSQMESFTAMRKRKMNRDHLNALENITEMEQQRQQSLLHEEKKLSFNQLKKITDLRSRDPLNHRDLLTLLEKFDPKTGRGGGGGVRSSSPYSLSEEEEKIFKDSEKFVQKCSNLLHKLTELNASLEDFLKNASNSSSDVAQKLAERTLRELTVDYLNDPLVERLRRGRDQTVLLSDNLVKRVTSHLDKQNQVAVVPPVPSAVLDPVPSQKLLSKPTSTMTATTAPLETSKGIDILLTDATNETTLTDEKKSLADWLCTLLGEYNQVMSTSADHPLTSLLQTSLTRLSELFELADDKRTTTRLTIEMSALEQALKSASNLSSPSSTVSSVQCCLLAIFSHLLNAVIHSDSEEKILFFGHLSGAICRVCGKIGGKVLYSYLCACTLHQTTTGETISVPILSNAQQRKRLILFYATQMGSVLAPSRVDITTGWAWLVRCGIMISRSIHHQDRPSLIELCSCLRGYLRIIGTDLQLTYGGKFMTLMKTISSTLSSSLAKAPQSTPPVELVDLQTLLTEFLRSGLLPCVLFKEKDSYSIYASSVIR